MVHELRLIANSLETINGVRVIRTRWYAEKINAELPAIIIDYSRPYDSLLIESGLELPNGDYYYLEVAVKPDFETDPTEPLERLETLVEQTRTALHAAFPYKQVLFLQPEVTEMPFGKQTSLSFIADLYIG